MIMKSTSYTHIRRGRIIASKRMLQQAFFVQRLTDMSQSPIITLYPYNEKTPPTRLESQTETPARISRSHEYARGPPRPQTPTTKRAAPTDRRVTCLGCQVERTGFAVAARDPRPLSSGNDHKARSPNTAECLDGNRKVARRGVRSQRAGPVQKSRTPSGASPPQGGGTAAATQPAFLGGPAARAHV